MKFKKQFFFLFNSCKHIKINFDILSMVILFISSFIFKISMPAKVIILSYIIINIYFKINDSEDKRIVKAEEKNDDISEDKINPVSENYLNNFGLKPPLRIGEKGDFLKKEEKDSTSIYLMAKEDNLEIIRQKIEADKVILIKGEENIFEYYYLLQGKVIRDEDNKELGPGSFISVQNSTGEVYFRTETECIFLYVTTSPIFENKQAEFEKLLALNEKVKEKDQDTREHCRRMEKLSLKTGRELKLNDERLFKLDYAAILHDIGKVNINSEILTKAGKLTKEEWKEMKQHPGMGKNLILKHLSKNFFDEIAEIVYQHHERYDGSGYPQGLKGEEIVKEAQILSVVDAYDAITSNRPYQKARSREEARKEIKKSKRDQFAPEVADAFLKIEKELYQKGELRN